MAHAVNYGMTDYSKIYANVAPILRADDFTFGNLEVPINDGLPLSTYPRFNSHSAYLAAAIDGGFDVFSLANNHSNDQGSAGIEGTRDALKDVSGRAYSSGLKKSADDRLQPVVIEKHGWKILFLAITEILNSYDDAGKLVYYVSQSESSRAEFLSEVRRLRDTIKPDVFVLSVHVNEPEYVRVANPEKKAWFRALASAGVDVVWGHHPHVMQDWECVPSSAPRKMSDAILMYSMGNFISGQRENPDMQNPQGMREYTGDSVLLRVVLARRKEGGSIASSVEVLPVTNYTEPSVGPVVRVFNGDFVNGLQEPLSTYFRARYELMKAYLPSLPLLEIGDILIE